MSEWTGFGRALILVGLGIVVVGILFSLADRFPGLGSGLSWLGKLPGDIVVKRDNFSFYFPVATSVVLSVLLSFLFYLLSWLFRR
jgi:predicted phosphohydrolase